MKTIYAIILAALLVGIVGADEVKVFGDKVVDQDMQINGDAIAVTGNLIVKGHVSGSAIAYVGDVVLDSTAVVEGDAVARRGRIIFNDGAKVSGHLIEGRMPGLKIGRDDDSAWASQDVTEETTTTISDSRDRDEDRPSRRYRHRHHDLDLGDGTDFKVSYNKVDGLFLGLFTDNVPFGDYGVHFRTFGGGGYAFSSHNWQGKIGFGVGVLPRGQLELSVDAFHQTQTEDTWYMSDTENSLAAFFLHEDFRDYYLREGFGTTLSWKPVRTFNLSARFQAEQQESLDNATNWALFGGDKTFHDNMLTQEGMLREFVLSTGFDTRDDKDEPSRGWRISAETELTDPSLHSDFDYHRFLLEARRYQPLGRFINLDNRVRLGNSDGILPPQKRFYLGGPSSLQGYSLKEFSGREFTLWNAELRLHDGRRQGSFLRHAGLIFFSDLGLAADKPLGDFRLHDWAHDVGVALSTNSGKIRVQVARRTDTSHDPYVWMLRIQRPF